MFTHGGRSTSGCTKPTTTPGYSNATVGTSKPPQVGLSQIRACVNGSSMQLDGFCSKEILDMTNGLPSQSLFGIAYRFPPTGLFFCWGGEIPSF